MAEGGRTAKGRRSGEAPASELLLTTPIPAHATDLPLPLELPPAMFTGPGLMGLADLLPVMTAFVDRSETYRFVNKRYSEWLGRSRREVLGMTMRELLGAKNYDDRKPMIDAAMKGERQFFAATFLLSWGLGALVRSIMCRGSTRRRSRSTVCASSSTT